VWSCYAAREFRADWCTVSTIVVLNQTKDITRFWIADESQARANLPKTLVSAKL